MNEASHRLKQQLRTSVDNGGIASEAPFEQRVAGETVGRIARVGLHQRLSIQNRILGGGGQCGISRGHRRGVWDPPPPWMELCVGMIPPLPGVCRPADLGVNTAVSWRSKMSAIGGVCESKALTHRPRGFAAHNRLRLGCGRCHHMQLSALRQP